MEAAQEVNYGSGVIGKLYYDEDPHDPRKEWDHIATLICAHDRYDLGDVQVRSGDDALNHIMSEDGVGVVCDNCGREVDRDYDEWWHADEDGDNESSYLCDGNPIKFRLTGLAAMVPLYLYDHSGITMSCGPFSCPWDSGQVGWGYITDKKYAEEHLTQLAADVIESEVKEYDQYLTGDVYGYIITFESYCGSIEEESCWGFFGMKYAMEEMNRVAQHMIGEANG